MNGIPVATGFVLIQWIIQNTANSFVALQDADDDDDEEEYQDKLKRLQADNLDLINLAIFLTDQYELNRPGRGFTWYNLPKNIPSLPNFNNTSILVSLANPSKCIAHIGFTPKEFNHMAGFVVVEAAVVGARNDNHFRTGKTTVRERFFIFLNYMNSQPTFRSMELEFMYAKSSIQADIQYMGDLLLTILKRELGTLWPTRAQRDFLKTLLPENLKNTGVFGIVDSFKLSNIDSTHKLTRRTHYNSHKGFGPNAILFSTVIGDFMALERFKNGNGNDLQQYHDTEVFHRENGKTMDADETLIGDSKYIGNVSNDPNSRQFCVKVTDAEMSTMNAQNYTYAENYNKSFDTLRAPIEQGIRYIKTFGVAGSSQEGRIKLHTHPNKKALLNDLACHLAIAKMRMRGQVFASNPAVLSHSSGGVNLADKIVRQHTGQLYTALGRESAFFGPALSGLQFHDYPDVIDL